MRAVVITRPGDPDVLHMEVRPDPVAGRDQVRVRIRAFGVNRAELLQRRGGYPAPPGWPSDIPGLEYAGEIDTLGPDVRDWAVGDRVMGIAGGGTYAEYVVVPAAHLLPMPGGMSFTEAAAVPEAFITAHDALERLCLARDEWVLVHAVGSGVGTAAQQLAHLRGASCIGTSRTPAKLRAAAAMGLDAAVDTRRDDWPATVRNMVPGGVHAALDLVGGDLFPMTLESLRERGRLVLVGLTAGRDVRLDLSVILHRRLRIEGTVLRSRSDDEKADLIRSFRERVLPAFETGALRPVVDRVYGFEQVADAHRRMEANESFGKIVVEVRR